MAIIHNGLDLFRGATGSGESEIRRYVIEHDWLDAIIQLPGDSFYSISNLSHVWILSIVW